MIGWADEVQHWPVDRHDAGLIGLLDLMEGYNLRARLAAALSHQERPSGPEPFSLSSWALQHARGPARTAPEPVRIPSVDPALVIHLDQRERWADIVEQIRREERIREHYRMSVLSVADTFKIVSPA